MSVRALLPLLFALVACAKPNYAPEVNSGAPPKATDTVVNPKPEACPLKFASKHCLSVTWELLPTEDETGAFIFRIVRPDPAGAVPEDLDGKLSVVAWMPGMGHGSSPITVERLDIGVYRASQVFFTMRGEWELRFLLKSGNETRDQATLPFIF